MHYKQGICIKNKELCIQNDEFCRHGDLTKLAPHLGEFVEGNFDGPSAYEEHVPEAPYADDGEAVEAEAEAEAEAEEEEEEPPGLPGSLSVAPAGLYFK